MRKNSKGSGLGRWSISSCTVSRSGRINRAIAISAFVIMAMSPQPASAETRLGLKEAIRLSLEHSYSIKSARHDSSASAYDLRAAKSLRFPAVSLKTVSFYIDDLQALNLPLEKVYLGSHDNYQMDLKLSWPLFTGGKISNRIKMQEEIARSRFSALEAERWRNAYVVRKAYLDLMVSQWLENSARASLERRKLISQDIENLYLNGMADSVDILEAQLALRKALQALDQQSAASKNASANLSRLTGIKVDGQFVLSDSAPTPSFEHYHEKGALEQQIDRAELKVIESNIRAANYNVSLSKADYLPNLNAFGAYSFGKPNKDLFNKTWNDYFTAGFDLDWVINLGGEARNSIRAAEQIARSAQMAEEELQESLTLEAEIAYENLALAYRNYVAASREYEIARRQFHLARERQKAGQLSVNRLLELEADLSATEDLFRVSAIRYFLFETEYVYAIGSRKIYGGF